MKESIIEAAREILTEAPSMLVENDLERRVIDLIKTNGKHVGPGRYKLQVIANDYTKYDLFYDGDARVNLTIRHLNALSYPAIKNFKQSKRGFIVNFGSHEIHILKYDIKSPKDINL
jgi:hypothetical protein